MEAASRPLASGPVPVTGALAHAVVGVAIRAPSVHNTQPWLFECSDGRLRLLADHSRRLAVADPAGRQLTISCGAALFTTRLALRGHGLDTRADRTDPSSPPHVLAELSATPGPPTTAAERGILAAVYRRHTHRGAFEHGPVGSGLLDELSAAAAAHGTTLGVVPTGEPTRRLEELVSSFQAPPGTAGRRAVELAAWTPGPAEHRRDGVPATAYPSRRAAAGGMPMRDFDLGRNRGRGDAPGHGDGVWAWLATAGDGTADWLACGEALQSVLLTAAARWAFAAIHTEPVEDPATRRTTAAALGVQGHLQILLRMGHAGRAPLTPRRDVAEVLRCDDGGVEAGIAG